MKILWAVFLWYIQTSTAQNTNYCEYYEKINANSRSYITSPNHPSNYTGGLRCRWIVDCPAGYRCHVNCPDVALPQTTGCAMDRLLISRSGHPQMANANVYCGRGSLTTVSSRQRISLGLITSRNTLGGRFQCEVTTQPVNIDLSCTCGVKRQTRIVGGQETGINEYPMMAGLIDKRIEQIVCGAVIISNMHVLTAAHCLSGLLVNSTAIVLGEHDVDERNETTATRVYNAAKFNIHPMYSDNTFQNDIGIVTSATTFVFNDRVLPVCLPFKFANKNFVGDKVTALGWGTLFPGGPVSATLQKVQLDVISEGQCRNNEPSVTFRQLCTYTAGKDACQFDSGGPLLYTDPSSALLYAAGIVSSGRSCASRQPGINTRVTQYLNWIVATTRTKFCMK